MEKWEIIEEFPSYEVSSKGRVKNKNGKIIKGLPNNNGYLRVCLYERGKCHRRFVHRLVAKAFIKNENNKPCVNHKDNDCKNNDAENLEWCTHAENMEWMKKQNRAKRTSEQRKALRIAQQKRYRAVIGINNINGTEIRFENLNSVKNAGFEPSCVCDCCKGKRMQHKGYRWRYEKTI